MSDSIPQEQNQLVKEKRQQDYLDVDVSSFVALTIGAQPNTCFENVLDMFLTYFPAQFSSSGSKFIEGWYVVDLDDEVIVNEHGWGEFPDGRIIDPTVVMLVPPAVPVYYFPGVERSWQEVKEIVLHKKDAWFPYVRSVGIYGADGLGHPNYNAAYKAATQKVFNLAYATRPPKRMTFLTAQDLETDQSGVEIHVQMFSISNDNHQLKGE
jgi:hypothetical protein